MSDAGRSPAHVVGFGTFDVDLRSGELRKAGVRIPLQEQPFRVLARLLQRPGELVTREELRQELWPDNTFLDFEHGLNAAIKRLRDALGDSADSPRFIETLPRRGYRFIAPVDARGDRPAPSAPPPDATPARVPHRRWTGATILLVLLAAVAAAAWWSRGAPPASSPPPPVESVEATSGAADVNSRRVAVATFDSGSADPALESLGAQVAGRIIRNIAQVPGLEAGPEPIAPAAGSGNDRRAAAIARARASGASLLVTGAMFVQGDRVELQCRILDTASGRLLHALPPLTAARADPGEAIDQLARQAAGAAAIHFDEFFGGLDVVSHPPTIDAYREYRVGLEIFQWDYPRALAHLQRALDADPQFWLPRVIMLFAYFNTGQRPEAREQLGRLERERDRVTAAERLLVDFLREDSQRRSLEALRVLRDLEALVPRSLLVNHNIVQQSLIQNRPRAAVEAYDRLADDVRTLRHGIGTWRMGYLTQALHLLGEHDRELEESRKGQQYAPGMLLFVEAEVRALGALGRLAELQKVVERSLSIPATGGTAGGVLEEAALTLRAHGHREASLAFANRAVEWHRSRPAALAAAADNRAALGRALYLAEQWDDAERVFVALAAETPGNPAYAGHIGACAARRGDVARARAVSADLERLSGPYLFGFHTAWRARIAALVGERQRAVDLLSDALAEGQAFGPRLHHNPDFEALREYAPFQELVRVRE